MALVLGDAARHDCHFVGREFPAIVPLRSRTGRGIVARKQGASSYGLEAEVFRSAKLKQLAVSPQEIAGDRRRSSIR
jgi:hypothetical protein